jgi:hypothetical protein
VLEGGSEPVDEDDGGRAHRRIVTTARGAAPDGIEAAVIG